MKIEYKSLRNIYYLGILLLCIYALKTIPWMDNNIIYLLETPILSVPIIIIIAIITAGLGFTAYKYKTIG